MAKSSYLCFQQGNYHFAIENSEILQILPAQSLFSPPLPIPGVMGFKILDNELVAVIDIVQTMFHEDPPEMQYHILISVNQEIIGIGAAQINGLKTIDDVVWKPYHKKHLPFIYQEAEDILYLIHLK